MRPLLIINAWDLLSVMALVLILVGCALVVWAKHGERTH